MRGLENTPLSLSSRLFDVSMSEKREGQAAWVWRSGPVAMETMQSPKKKKRRDSGFSIQPSSSLSF